MSPATSFLVAGVALRVSRPQHFISHYTVVSGRSPDWNTGPYFAYIAEGKPLLSRRPLHFGLRALLRTTLHLG